MQLDREGIDDTQQTQIDLEKHLQENGLSEEGMKKLRKDIENGDMNAAILIEFGENELLQLGDEYKLTTLQKKAFIKAVKLLPNSQASTDDGRKSTNETIERIYITQQEQDIFNQMNQLQDNLNNYSTKYKKVKMENKSIIEQSIKKLHIYATKLKNTIDNSVNALIKQVKGKFQKTEIIITLCVCFFLVYKFIL